MHDAGTLTPAEKSCNSQIAIEVHGILLLTVYEPFIKIFMLTFGPKIYSWLLHTCSDF